MFLIVSLGFPCLLIQGRDLGERLGLILTLLLTAVAYKNQISEHLPKCPYLTHLDKYVIFCILMLVLFCVESAVVYEATKFDMYFEEIEDDVTSIGG